MHPSVPTSLNLFKPAPLQKNRHTSRFHRAKPTSARYRTPMSKCPPTSAYGANTPIAKRLGAGQQPPMHTDYATPLRKRDHLEDARGVEHPLTIAVDTAQRLVVRTGGGIENQSREVKRDRKPEHTPESKGESIGDDAGVQLPNCSRNHSLMKMTETHGVCNGLQLPIAIQARHGIYTGVCSRPHLWVKHGGYMCVAPLVLHSVCTAVNSG